MAEPALIERFPGLSEAEAARRLAADGPNELPSDHKRTWLRTVFEVLREPMLLLLVGAAVLYLALGDLREALTLCVAVVVVIVITLVQERRTENALSALRDLSSPRARVIRDGTERRVPGREVVRGDIVVVSEGDRVPADGMLRAGTSVQIDESLLTGESVPVRKRPAPNEEPSATTQPGGDDLPQLYSGSLVVRGQGVLEVAGIGSETAIGRIGKTLAAVDGKRTPLQHQVDRLVLVMSLFAAVVCATVVLLLGVGRGNWVDALLAGIALAMSMLPEEFPVVLTVFLALGAWRLSRGRVLTRRMPALESLGSATVLCADKTGTLTQNRMQIARLVVDDRSLTIASEGTDVLPEAFHVVVEFGILASQSDPFDPMERAFTQLGERALQGTEHLHGNWKLEREYPLSPDLLAMSHVWSAPGGDRYVIAAKGAPEAIVDLCHLPADRAHAIEAQVHALAKEGLRVLAVARAYFEPPALPDDQHAFEFRFEGLVALADPIRPKVPAAIAACHAAGMRVIMITGDYPETARAIGRQIGLEGDGAVLSGPELSLMSDAELAHALETATIVARAVPEQKLRIVEALQANGEVVAMTGDGVNDAPALKAAMIGVAMGGRGTDVAREAAELVVTDDDFASIVDGVATGRRIQDNLRRALAYVVAVHVPIAGIALAPVLFGWPLVLFPVHIAFLELVIDPASSIAFEAEPPDPGIMTRAPRTARRPLFGRRLIAWSVAQGASVLAAAAAVMWWANRNGLEAGQTRALTFAALIAGNLMLILVNRSWTRSFISTLAQRNLAIWVITAAAALFLGAALFIPPVAELFHFEAVAPRPIAAAIGAGLASLLWFELVKLVAPGAMGER